MQTASVQGALTFATVREQLAAASKLQGPRVDLAACPHIDSAGAAFLLELARRNSGRLEIINANEQVRSLLGFFQLNDVLTVV
jgi:ABC-type transporter Mla MlaB component